ncbi:MAG: hypothetical protein R6U19_10315, partial [Bacteroidales bacterium]
VLLSFSCPVLIRLWAVFLILWGVSALPIKSGWKAFFSLLLIFAALGYALQDKSGNSFFNISTPADNVEIHFNAKDYSGEDTLKDTERGMEFQREQIPHDTSISNTHLELNGAAGSFTIRKPTRDYLLDFQKKGNVGDFRVETRQNDDTHFVDITLNKARISGRDHFNKANILLHPDPVWSFNLNLGASDTRLELEPFKVKQVSIKGGASNVDLTLGTRYKDINVDVESGATSVLLRIPEEAGCQVHFNSFLAGKNLKGFRRESRNYYYTPGFKEKDTRINVHVKSAVSSFKIKRY